jgi:hypothetical protein
MNADDEIRLGRDDGHYCPNCIDAESAATRACLLAS